MKILENIKGHQVPIFTFTLTFLFTLFSFFAEAMAHKSCSLLFEKSEQELLDPFTAVEKVETSLEHLTQEISVKFKNAEIADSLNLLLERVALENLALERLQEQLLHHEVLDLAVYRDVLKKLDGIKLELQTLEAKKATRQAEEAVRPNPNLSEIISDPAKVHAEKSYAVDLYSGQSVEVIFSSALVKSVFADTSKYHVISRSLRRLQKGIFGPSYVGEGVIRLFIDPSVFEIRAIGRDGSFRFFGYIHKNELHLVDYTISSDHSKTITNAHAKNVLSAKRIRGH